MLGDAGPERYAKALEIAAKDPNSDGLLVILTPQAMTDPTQTAEQIKPFAKPNDKPVLATWMGGPDVAAGETILNRHGVPTFPYPDTAARMFALMWGYSINLKALYETPVLPSEDGRGDGRKRADGVLQKVRAAGRTILTEIESKQVLAAYDIPTVEAHFAATAAGRGGRRGADRLSGRAEAALGDADAQERRRRRAVEPGRRRGRATRVRHDRRRPCASAPGDGHFLGVTVQKMADAGRLRADPRQFGSTRSSGRCCCSARAAGWSRSTRTARSACRR